MDEKCNVVGKEPQISNQVMRGSDAVWVLCLKLIKQYIWTPVMKQINNLYLAAIVVIMAGIMKTLVQT